MKKIVSVSSFIIISVCLSCSNKPPDDHSDPFTPEQIKEMIFTDYENINRLFDLAEMLLLEKLDDETLHAKEELDHELSLLEEKYASLKTSESTKKYVTAMLSYLRLLQIFSKSHLLTLIGLYEHAPQLNSLTGEYQTIFDNTLNDLSVKLTVERDMFTETIQDLPETNRDELDY